MLNKRPKIGSVPGCTGIVDWLSEQGVLHIHNIRKMLEQFL